jgi:hypothetical protein
MTITIPDLGIEVQSFTWPDMGDLIPCEWSRFNPWDLCDRPAEWVMWRACCSDKAKCNLYCTDHKDFAVSDGSTVCRICESVFTPGSTIFRLIEPLS